MGTEIKSVRAGQVDLRAAYARPQGSELWLLNAYIAPYDPSGPANHDPRRPRKLLLHREQILKLTGTVAQKGLTMVALRVYIKGHVAKVELAWPEAGGSTTNGAPSSAGSWTWTLARRSGQRASQARSQLASRESPGFAGA